MQTGVVWCFYVEVGGAFLVLPHFCWQDVMADTQAAILGGSHLGLWGVSPCKVRQSNETEWAWSLTLMHSLLCLWALETEINCDLVCCYFCIFSQFNQIPPQSHDSAAFKSHQSLSVLIPLEPQYYCWVALHPRLSPDSGPFRVLCSAWSSFFPPSYLEYLILNENNYS